MSTIEKQLFTRPEAAEYLSLAPQTLAQWAVSGKGPPVVKLGRNVVRYRRADLDAWCEQHLTRPAPAPGQEPSAPGLGLAT
jgi:excisionase family DNA binding protein